MEAPSAQGSAAGPRGLRGRCPQVLGDYWWFTVTWELVFYSDKSGREPVREWLDDLDDVKRAAAMRGLSVILAHFGPSVAGTEYGRWLSHGLFEFRLRIDAATILAKHDVRLLSQFPDQPQGPVLLRVFCHSEDGRVIVLLGAYDKGLDPSDRRQIREIARARKRLTDHQMRSRPGSRFRSWWVGQVRGR